MLLSRRTSIISAVAWACCRSAGAAPSQEGETAAALGRRLLASAPYIGERSVGSPDARVLVVEYASASCSHCARFRIGSWPQIRDAYVDTGKVRWIFREFPLDSLALAAFMLARCMPEEQYFQAIDILFRSQARWKGPAKRKELARTMRMAGMSRADFAGCMARQDLAEAIIDIYRTARTEFAVKSTPTFFINGQRVNGTKDFAFFKTLLDAELARQMPRNGR